MPLLPADHEGLSSSGVQIRAYDAQKSPTVGWPVQGKGEDGKRGPRPDTPQGLLEGLPGLLVMQIVGGIGYTDVFPIERMLRDIRLTQIWTGTNEIMDLLIQHEYYQEVLGNPSPGRLVEADAAEANADSEKVYEDEEMWVKGW